MNSPFRMPNFPISRGSQYRQREEAPTTSPLVPSLAEVKFIADGKVQFFDVAQRTSEFTLPVSDFREVYDPATS